MKNLNINFVGTLLLLILITFGFINAFGFSISGFTVWVVAVANFLGKFAPPLIHQS